VPPELREGRERRRLGSWKVPLRVGGRVAAVEGYVEYRPLLGQIVPAFTGPTMPARGVVAAILPGPVPGIFLDTTSRRERVTVLGSAGEPFLRFGPRGVEANERSPSQHADALSRGEPPSVPADAGARPRWRPVAEDARYSWLETRARYPREQPPDPVIDAGRRRALVDWRVPLEVDGDRTELRGVTSWIPTVTGPTQRSSREDDETGAGPWIGALAVLTVLGIGGAVAAGRRRRTPAR
jgi:hypothetical protein